MHHWMMHQDHQRLDYLGLRMVRRGSNETWTGLAWSCGPWPLDLQWISWNDCFGRGSWTCLSRRKVCWLSFFCCWFSRLSLVSICVFFLLHFHHCQIHLSHFLHQIVLTNHSPVLSLQKYNVIKRHQIIVLLWNLPVFTF